MQSSGVRVSCLWSEYSSWRSIFSLQSVFSHILADSGGLCEFRIRNDAVPVPVQLETTYLCVCVWNGRSYWCLVEYML